MSTKMKRAEAALLLVMALFVCQTLGQYGPPPAKGKKHRTTTTTTETPEAISNEISGPFPLPDTSAGSGPFPLPDTGAGSGPFPLPGTSAGSGSYSFAGASSSSSSSSLPGSTQVTGGSYWWAGPDSPFKPGSQPSSGAPPPTPPPSSGGCGGPAGCTGLGSDHRPSPAEPPGKPVDIHNNPFLSSAILGKPIPSSPQGCQGAGGSCQYPSGPTQYPGTPSGTNQYPGVPGNPGGPSQYPGQPTGQSPFPGSGTGPSQYPGSPTSSGQYPSKPSQPSGQYPGQPSSTSPSQYPGQSSPTNTYPGSSTGTNQYPGQPGGSSPFPAKPTGSSPYPGQPSGFNQYPNQPTGSSQYPGQPTSQFPSQPTGFSQYPGQPTGSSQYPGQSIGSSRPKVPLRPLCSSAGHACVPSSMCVGGVITSNGLRSMRDPEIKECIPGLEACCRIPTSSGGFSTPNPGYGQGTTPRPYTGPLNTTPYPGCAAALKCVAESYCTAEGVMSDTPVVLTREQLQNKVPTTDCQDPDTGIIGKCCRDPNYKDPWPAGMMMKNPGDYDDGQYHGEGSGPTVSIGPSYNTISSTPHTPGKDHGPKPSDSPGGFNKPFPPPFPGNTPASPSHGKVQPSGNYPSNKPGAPQQPGQTGPGSYQPGQPTGTPYQPGPTGSYQPGQPQQPGAYQPGQPSPTGAYQPGQPNSAGAYQPGQPSPAGAYQPGQTGPTGYQPGQPTPTAYQPGQPSSSGTYKPGQPSPTGTYQPGKPSPAGAYQPGQTGPTGYQPGQPTPTAYQPGQPSSSGTYQPGQPSPTGTYQPGQPAPSDSYQPGQPSPGGPSQPGYGLPTHPGHQEPAGSPGEQGPAPGSSCGIRRPGPGGDVAGFAEFPWQALVVSAGNRTLMCGAAIISDNAVITAAHCVNQLQANDLLVKAGEWKLLAQNPKLVQVRPVAAIARHPSYNSGSLAKDLAILVLAEPLTFDYHVDKICIPPELGSEYFQKPGQNCVLTGWGKNALLGPVQGSDLHKIDVDVIPAKQCEAKLKTSQNLGKYFILNEGFSCALPPSPSDLCKVDFGSAVACIRGDGHYELAGVNSWDVACPTNQPLPSVFATSDAQWIDTVLSTPLPVLQSQEESYNQGLLQGESVDGVDIDDKPGFSQGYGK